ncbi:MAG: hypothetical protein B6I28_00320 [Fusobacteriia bacterium 4572_132]|nr:MAG: hypothetical protein B6I28_00320 [Fusobacteriia bacterium 4572_132]
MNYTLNGHNSFYIREGWLGKGYTFIKNQEEISANLFYKTNIKTIDKLGMGSMMVQSLRFWLQVFGIIEKQKNKWKLSKIAIEIFEKDKYLQKNSSLWLLHYNILNKEEEKPLYWYLVFQEKKNLNTFKKDQLKDIANIFAIENTLKVSDKTLKDGLNVFIKTYIHEKFNKNSPEENMFSPFSRLKYLVKNEEGYRFRNINSDEISENIVLYILLDQLNNQEKLSLGKAFDIINGIIRMSYIEFEKIISKLENNELIKVDRAGGLDNIIFNENIKKYEILTAILEGESIL